MTVSDQASSGAELQRYYRLQSKIYDASRWAFLFGRGRMVDDVAALRPARVLEIGCGTGYNLQRLAQRLPDAHLTGVDLSEHMLERAQRKLAKYGSRIELRAERFSAAPLQERYDVVMLAYALTMMNPGFERVLQAAADSLLPGGRLAVVDFDHSPVTAFRRWMGVNHVRMEGQVSAVLKRQLMPCQLQSHKAYAGLWSWFTCIGTPVCRSPQEL